MAELAQITREHLTAGRPVALDCTGVEIADIAFVQFVVSARRSFAARDLPLTLEGTPPVVLAAFARAAVPPSETTAHPSGE